MAAVSTLLTIVATCLAIRSFFHARRIGSDDAPALAHDLATAIRAGWIKDQRELRLYSPRPLSLRWRAANPCLMDQWANIRWGALDVEVDIDGCLPEAADLYAKVPSGRVMVLGRAGAGKTVAAMQLGMALLDRRREATDAGIPGHPDRVPVLFSLAGWDPRRQSLHAWLVRRLGQEHPNLRLVGAKDGASGAQRLVDGDWILPILDGLDELAPAHRALALREMDVPLPMIVTCRSDAYADAVGAVHPLARAVCVEMCDVDLEDLADYLPRTLGTAADVTSKWTPVLDALRAGEDAPPADGDSTAADRLRAALRTPLMISLARRAYSDTRADPADLLEARRFPTRAAIEEHLLEAFIPATYDEEGGARGAEVARYLSFLAARADASGDGTIAWWTLRGAVPWLFARTALAVGLISALCFGVPLGFTIGAQDNAGLGAISGLAFGGAVGIVLGIVCLVGIVAVGSANRPPRPLRLGRHFDGWKALPGIAVGVALGAAGSVAGLAHGLIFGLLLAVLLGAARGFEEPVEITTAADPAAVLRADRAGGVFLGAICGLLGLAIGFALVDSAVGGLQAAGLRGNAQGAWGPLAIGLGLALLLTGATIGAAASEWGLLGIVGIWLALRRLAPLDLMAFLAEARDRGVLREVGGLYEFRHSSLREYLVRECHQSVRPIRAGVMRSTRSF